MKIKSSQARRGSAMIVVMLLLAVMATFVVCNARTLATLKGELKLIDHKQQKKFAPVAPAK